MQKNDLKTLLHLETKIHRPNLQVFFIKTLKSIKKINSFFIEKYFLLNLGGSIFCLEIKTSKNQPCIKEEKISFFKLKNLGTRLEKAKCLSLLSKSMQYVFKNYRTSGRK